MGEDSHHDHPVDDVGEYYREKPSLVGEIVTAHGERRDKWKERSKRTQFSKMEGSLRKKKVENASIRLLIRISA